MLRAAIFLEILIVVGLFTLLAFACASHRCAPAIRAHDELAERGAPHHRTVFANHVKMAAVQCPVN